MNTHEVLEAYGKAMNLAAVLYSRSVTGDFQGKNNRWNSPIPQAIRFWDKVEFGDGCWEWKAGTSRYGYGLFSGREAHSYLAQWLGYETNRFHVIDHECENPICVRPTHLRLVTTRFNVLRGTSPLASFARQTHCKRGHLLSGENLYVPKRGGRDCKACGRLRAAERRKNNS